MKGRWMAYTDLSSTICTATRKVRQCIQAPARAGLEHKKGELKMLQVGTKAPDFSLVAWQEKKNYGRVPMVVACGSLLIRKESILEKVIPGTNAGEMLAYLAGEA